MKIALVHDYIKEFGGAERVLRTLADMYPEAPIYTAFRVKNSKCDLVFKDRIIKESWLAPLLKIGRLYSPLRFLLPLVWRSFNLNEYDLVITSASWYVTRGFRVGEKTKVVCYCHTPPRYLYGYETSVDLQKYWPVKLYAMVVNHFLRLYDFWTVKSIDKWVVNSENVKRRVKKFYRVDAQVIYPPVEVERLIKVSERVKKQDYFLYLGRLVGAKGIEEVVGAAEEIGFKLVVAGGSGSLSKVKKRIERLKKSRVEILGWISDKKREKLFSEALGFLALARDEDFGITPVEAMAAGTPVIAFNGGGFKESVVDGETGVLINDTDIDTLKEAVERVKKTKWKKEVLQRQARKFSREVFEEKMKKVVNEIMREK